MEERMGIAVVGDRDSIYYYAALGLDIYPVADGAEAKKTIAQLSERRYAVIYLTEQLADGLQSELLKYRDQRIPAIIPIPGVSGNTGYGMRSVREAVEKAVGSDIIFGGEN